MIFGLYISTIFILKSGKRSYTRRGIIDQSAFVLFYWTNWKDAHITALIDTLLLSSSQYAYTNGKSMETTLHSLIYLAARAWFYKNIWVKNNFIFYFWRVNGKKIWYFSRHFFKILISEREWQTAELALFFNILMELTNSVIVLFLPWSIKYIQVICKIC